MNCEIEKTITSGGKTWKHREKPNMFVLLPTPLTETYAVRVYVVIYLGDGETTVKVELTNIQESRNPDV